jgi:hypothetical protein
MIVAMSNAKVQMSNQVQITNEMPKQVRHDEGVILNSFQNLILKFESFFESHASNLTEERIWLSRRILKRQKKRQER